ncbi:MAG: class I SAM-dependent methyltransferase [Deltaproteobacteria bacterium]|nr:class I SAM-dependent methyltransferase [Deltaproteobacteria bacterium]
MAHPSWNDAYAQGFLPWDTGKPDSLLVAFVKSTKLKPTRALEIGCGTGTNAIWLASKGFDVLGVDLAPLAVEQARAKAKGAKRVRFEVMDILGDAPIKPVGFVFDRGCFHVFDEAKERARFAERVASALKPGGLWLTLVGSTEVKGREMGPPRRTARDIVDAIEPELEVLELRTTEFDTQFGPMKCWTCVSRKRKFPAALATGR